MPKVLRFHNFRTLSILWHYVTDKINANLRVITNSIHWARQNPSQAGFHGNWLISLPVWFSLFETTKGNPLQSVNLCPEPHLYDSHPKNQRPCKYGYSPFLISMCWFPISAMVRTSYASILIPFPPCRGNTSNSYTALKPQFFVC